MRTDFYYRSQCGGQLHGCRWTPEGEVKAIVQIVHGIADYAARYGDFAEFLNTKGILVVAEDHMGHGQSITAQSPKGCFNGGWFGAVEDSYRLMQDTMAEFPGVPYILFGHSMGSFMARTILAKYPDSGIAAAIICGTAWQPSAVVLAGRMASKLVCKTGDPKKPSQLLHTMGFGSYNRRIEHPRTASDWLSRDKRAVDAYEADPLCGFVASAGLMADLTEGVAWIQDERNTAAMKKDLPVFFIAGGDDPVGDYGSGVLKAVEMFKKWGIEQVCHKIYPLCRHEILNEINKEEVYNDVYRWINSVI